MTDAIDREVAAIKAVLAALEPLEAGVRANVLDYVLKRLGITAARGPGPEAPPTTRAQSGYVATSGPVHVKAFKEQKKPRSANEMAAVVAYYLANLLPDGDRKQTVSAKDIETYFKIADFPLPRAIRVTLPNARAAGYFDSAGEGEYRLNAVGHNLVVHNLPHGEGAARGSTGRKGARSRRGHRPRTQK